MKEEDLAQPAILLVDDVPANLLAMEAVLGSLKVPMVATRSGSEALACIERQPFAVALVDVQMPGMDGFELAQRMRQTQYGREVPILFVTAVHRDEDFVRRGYAWGAADYITKPFDPQVVRARVKAFIDLYRQREGVRRRQVALRTQERDEAIRRLVAFERIAAAALETNDLHALLDELLQAFIDAADAADSGSILLREGDHLRLAASVGAAAGDGEQQLLPVGVGSAGLIAQERRAVELHQDALQRLAGPVAGTPPRVLYGTPLMHEGQVIGVAQIGSTRASSFTPQEKRLFLAASERASLAVAKNLQLSRLNQVLTAVPAYIAIVDAASKQVVFANPFLRMVLDHDPIGTPFAELGFGPAAEEATGRAIASAETLHLEELRIHPPRPGGKVASEAAMYVSLTAQPLLTENGLVDRVLVFATDVTAQILARHELEETERVRVHLLQREREARIAAEVASRSKDEFLATVSHELRTPLNAIMGWAALARTNPELDVQRALAVIERNAHAQARIVEDVLDFARVARGEMRLTRQALDLGDLVDGALETVRPSADAKRIQLEVDLAAEQPVFGDAERLRQVVLNLLSNAVKYSESGSTVRVQATSKAGLATMRVTDSGCGIAPSFLPQVFEPFRQADGSTTRRHGGLGLGLAIAKQIVDAHGGLIEASSDGLGQGASFLVELPTEQSFAAEAPSSRRESGTMQKPDVLLLDGIRVLLVDDDTDGRDLVVETLTAHGASVSALASSSEALSELERLHPDVLVSDISMPDLDGYQLLRRIRALPAERGGETPALALTAHAGDDVAERALRSGFHRYLSKPLDVASFIAVVAGLARESATRPRAAQAARR